MAYTYDAAFNRLTETTTRRSDGQLTQSRAYHYNNRHQLTALDDVLDAAQNITYSFDANGNQTRQTQNGITTAYTYTARDRLQQVQVGATTVGTFRYDHQGLRIEKQGARGTERYSWDEQSVLLQTDASNQLTAHYQYGPDQLLSPRTSGSGLAFCLPHPARVGRISEA